MLCGGQAVSREARRLLEPPRGEMAVIAAGWESGEGWILDSPQRSNNNGS